MSGTVAPAGGVLQRGEDRWGHDGALQPAALQHGEMSADNPVSHIATVQQQQSAGQIPTVQLVQCCSGLTGSTTMAAGPGSAQCAQCRSGYRHTVEYITHSESIEILIHSSFSYFLFWNRKKVRQKSLGIVGQLLKYQVSEN